VGAHKRQQGRYRTLRRSGATLSIVVLITFASAQQLDTGTTDLYETFLRSKERIEANYLARTGTTKVWGLPDSLPLVRRSGRVLFEDHFASPDQWHHEGIGSLALPQPGILELVCEGSAQGEEGCMVFTRQDLPDSITVEFCLKVLTTRGLVIVMIGVQGTSGEDLITGLPPRRGTFADYVLNPRIRAYHVSLSRYDDDGRHTGVSNWRRSPGLVLMGQEEDLCKEPGRWYALRLTKLGGHLQLEVDGQFAGGFVDPGEVPGPFPGRGKLGFRLIGSDVRALIANLQVRRYTPEGPIDPPGPRVCPPQEPQHR
jgi:hypothetical protein